MTLALHGNCFCSCNLIQTTILIYCQKSMSIPSSCIIKAYKMRTVSSESKSFTIMMAVHRLLICLRVRVIQVSNLLELTMVWPQLSSMGRSWANIGQKVNRYSKSTLNIWWQCLAQITSLWEVTHLYDYPVEERRHCLQCISLYGYISRSISK